MNYCLKVICIFTFKNINVRVRILDNKKKKKKKKKKKNAEKLKRYTFKMICIFATDSI